MYATALSYTISVMSPHCRDYCSTYILVTAESSTLFATPPGCCSINLCLWYQIERCNIAKGWSQLWTIVGAMPSCLEFCGGKCPHCQPSPNCATYAKQIVRIYSIYTYIYASATTKTKLLLYLYLSIWLLQLRDYPYYVIFSVVKDSCSGRLYLSKLY